MSLYKLTKELEIKSSIIKIKDRAENIECKIYNYLSLLNLTNSEHISYIFEVIKDVHTVGYNELMWQLAVNAIKNPIVKEKPAQHKEVKPSIKDTIKKLAGKDIEKGMDKNILELLEKARKHKKEGD